MKVKSWSYENTTYDILSKINDMIISGEITEVVALTMAVGEGHKAHHAILIYK